MFEAGTPECDCLSTGDMRDLVELMSDVLDIDAHVICYVLPYNFINDRSCYKVSLMLWT